MDKKKILIVDDDQVIREILEFNLSNEGFDVEGSYSAEDALIKLNSSYSLILLDVMMGGISGYKFAEQLRKSNNNIPIIFLTAKNTENDLLTGFSVGGDDYIEKPFSIKEVIVRIKAIIKRHYQTNEPNVFAIGDFVLNFKLKELLIGSEKINLTKTEYKILSLLVKNKDSVVSREDILAKIWQNNYITERTVDVHITRIRKKMKEKSNLISNQTGFGYKFNYEKI